MIGVLAALLLNSALAGPVELRELVQGLGKPLFRQTYEGYALAERFLGHPVYDSQDLDALLARLGEQKNAELAADLEKRLNLVDSGLKVSDRTLAELAGEHLALAPMRASLSIEFLAPVGQAGTYASSQAAFLAGDVERDVLIHISMGYGDFNQPLLARLTAMGLKIKPGYEGRSLVVGKAPMSQLRQLSGIDGVDRLMAYQTRGYAELHYRHGVKAVTE